MSYQDIIKTYLIHPMNIYTTYFANIRNLPSDVIPISISLYPPKGYSGLTYPPLFPTPEILKLAKSGNLPPEKYIPLYKHQVLDHLDLQKVILDIQELSMVSTIMFLALSNSD